MDAFFLTSHCYFFLFFFVVGKKKEFFMSSSPSFSDLCGEYRTLLLSDSKSDKTFYHNVCYTFLPNGKHITLLTFIVNKNNKTIFTSDDVDKALEVYNEI